MSETALMSGLMSARIPLTKRVLTLLTSLTLEMGILRNLQKMPRSIPGIVYARSVCRYEKRAPPTHSCRMAAHNVEEAGSSRTGEEAPSDAGKGEVGRRKQGGDGRGGTRPHDREASPQGGGRPRRARGSIGGERS